MLHSAILDSPLVLTVPEPGPASIRHHANGVQDAEALVRLIPIIQAEQEEFALSGDGADAEELRGLTELHLNAVDCTKGVTFDARLLSFLTKEDAVAQRFRTALETFRLSNCGENPDAPDIRSLARACPFDMSVCYNLVLGIPHRHVINQASVRGLYDALRAIDDDIWKRLPYLRLQL